MFLKSAALKNVYYYKMKTNSQTDGSLLNNRLSNKNIENLMAMHIGKIITDGVRGFHYKGRNTYS